MTSPSKRELVLTCLNLNTIYKAVDSYPQISGVPNVAKASRQEVLNGYKRIKQNEHIAPLCEQIEADLERDQARTIQALLHMMGELDA